MQERPAGFVGWIAQLVYRAIHGVGEQGLRTGAAEIVEEIYIVAIAVIVGLMVFIGW